MRTGSQTVVVVCSALMVFSIVLSSIAVTVAVTTESSMLSNSNRLATTVPNVTCGRCKEIVSLLYNVSGNRIQLNTTIEVLIARCKSEFQNQTQHRHECVEMMKLAQDILPVMFWGLNAIAWDIPITFCADVVGVCLQPCCEAMAPPDEIFLSFNDSKDLSQMRVTWITLNETEGAMVQWWLSGANDWNIASAKETASRSYTAGGWVGVIHSAVMTNLLPGENYTYRVGSPLFGWSDNITFHTMPSNIGTVDRPLRVLQFADMGSTDKATPTMELAAKLVDSGAVDLIIHNGDIGYADGDEHRWDIFMRKIFNFTAKVPYMTTPGNHELYMNFTAYRARLRASMPEAKPAAPEGNMYYGLTVGPVEFVFLDSETWFDTGNLDAAQLAWFSDHMSLVNRREQPFVMVSHHRPLYCALCFLDYNCGVLRSQAEDVYLQWGVDVHIAGHWHNYQRMYPLYNGTVMSYNYTNPPAPVYIVNGAAGNFEGQKIGDAAAFVAAGTLDYGLATMSFFVEDGNAVMDFAFYNSYSQKIYDSFSLVKRVPQ